MIQIIDVVIIVDVIECSSSCTSVVGAVVRDSVSAFVVGAIASAFVIGSTIANAVLVI